jgi:2-dehydropantoate 2-reductase
VQLVGRPRMLGALRSAGLTLTDRDGGHLQLAPAQLQLLDAVPAGATPALVLLCVKSGATAAAAAELAARLPAGTLVVSMQNGIANAAIAQAQAPQLVLLAGMVPYNIAELAPGQLHRGTAGVLAMQDHPRLRPWLPVLCAAGLPVTLHADMAPLQWGKLLLNLNNAVNALSDLPLRAQLLDRHLRACTAALINETLGVLARAGIRPTPPAGPSPALMVQVMRLPTPLFRLLAARLLRIDGQARSSMADDLALGRPTEVDAIQGEVVRLAQRLGMSAPLNARISALVRGWPQHPMQFSGPVLRQTLGV